MMNLTDYFDPVSIDKPLWGHLAEPSYISHNFIINTASNPVEKINDEKLAIIGVPDDRRSPNKGSSGAPDAIRESLYQLSRLPGKSKIVDLGNLKKGPGFEDTLAGLNDVLLYLFEKGTMALIIGGSSSVIPAIGKAFSDSEILYNYTSIDSRIDFVNEKKYKDSFNYLGDLIYNKHTSLTHFINIGYQTYLNDPQSVNRFRKLNYELLRVGEVRSDMHETEPRFRDSELITLDISSVRQSDAPGTFAPSPNGFYTEEICLLARYAGLSDSLKVFGLFEVNPLLDNRNLTCALAAQILWFFLEGFVQKQNESTIIGKENSGRFVKYHVRVNDIEEDIIFIKSNITNRWWLEIENKKGIKSYISCSYNDYIKAGENEIPARWLNTISRQR